MSNAGAGTYRGTPKGRGTVPSFVENSPSAIPRPKLETHASSALQSETGTSTLSANRQKQIRKDEVNPRYIPKQKLTTLTAAIGYQKKGGG